MKTLMTLSALAAGFMSLLTTLAISADPAPQRPGLETSGIAGKSYESLPVIAFLPGKVIELKAGEAIRLSDVTQPLCEKSGAGVKALKGAGAVFKFIPDSGLIPSRLCIDAKSKRPNATASECGRQTFLPYNPVFLAKRSPTKIQLVAGTIDEFGVGCGE